MCLWTNIEISVFVATPASIYLQKLSGLARNFIPDTLAVSFRFAGMKCEIEARIKWRRDASHSNLQSFETASLLAVSLQIKKLQWLNLKFNEYSNQFEITRNMPFDVNGGPVNVSRWWLYYTHYLAN